MADEWAIVRAVREPRCPCSVSSLLDLPDSHKGLDSTGWKRGKELGMVLKKFDECLGFDQRIKIGVRNRIEQFL